VADPSGSGTGGPGAQVPPEGPAWRARHWKVLAFLTVVVSGLWIATQTPAGQSRICSRIDEWPAQGLICEVEYDSVSVDEAEQFLLDYYDVATRTDPHTSWGTLAQTFRDRYDDETAYARELQSTLWSELLSDPERVQDGDVFSVVVRRYTSSDFSSTSYPLTVASDVVRVRLVRSESGDVRLADSTPQPYASGSRLSFVQWVELPRAVDLRRRPSSGSETTLEASEQTRTGGRLRALCELRVPAGSPRIKPEDVGWWTRTTQGWVRNDDTSLAGRRQGLLRCGTVVLGQ
jgi:hypothetical protein